MSNTCIICGDDETASPLFRAPCGGHYVCSDCLTDFFKNAIKDESLYPPNCCQAPFLLMDYEENLPFELSWEYQVKEQGEYSVLKKFRVYCASPACNKFMRPDTHVADFDTQVTYAICEGEECGKFTCVTCRTVLVNGVVGHVCEVAEVDKQFKDTAQKEGYQECYICGSTVELTEACNHIHCECGNDFCYICGKAWTGLHGCPHYGPAEYDDDGYNQEGYHRDTGLNRAGLTRLQQNLRDSGENEDEEDEEEEEEEEQDRFPRWVTPEFRAMLVQLPEDLIDEAIESEMLRMIENGEFVPEEQDENEEDAEGEDDEEEENDDENGENGDEAEGNREIGAGEGENEITDAAAGINEDSEVHTQVTELTAPTQVQMDETSGETTSLITATEPSNEPSSEPNLHSSNTEANIPATSHSNGSPSRPQTPIWQAGRDHARRTSIAFSHTSHDDLNLDIDIDLDLDLEGNFSTASSDPGIGSESSGPETDLGLEPMAIDSGNAKPHAALAISPTQVALSEPWLGAAISSGNHESEL